MKKNKVLFLQSKNTNVCDYTITIIVINICISETQI